MNRLQSILPFLLAWVTSTSASLVDHVDPFIGTDESEVFSLWRMEGGTYPGAVAPHGMIQITPETSTGKDFLKGYYYSRDTIYRFSLVDHLSGWPSGSAGKVTIMPGYFSDRLNDLKMDELASRFSHENEEATPGYYRVYLQDSKINCRFSSLPRSAIGEFHFEGDEDPVVMLGRYQSVQQVAATEIHITSNSGNYGMGDHYTIHLRLIFDQPFELTSGQRTTVLSFKGRSVKFKCGVSYTNADNAAMNVLVEIPEWDLGPVKAAAGQLWERQLRKILVEGEEDADKTMFYTGFYHASLLPIAATDVNRQYPGQEENPPLEPDETHYVYFTPWDAFRTKHPMINLIDPLKGRDYLRSIVRYYRSYGRLPEPEVMTGVHMSMLVADALSKGITDFDVATAYQGLCEMIREKPYFREDMSFFRELGYVPYPRQYATSATLEFSFNDWALAQVARYLNDLQTATELERTSLNYRNNYHPGNRFMQTRNKDGSWAHASLYAESDKWNNSWLVPHNVRDLVNLMGGDAAFIGHLERNFTESHFTLDNENPMNFPFLFSYAGAPEKSMQWAKAALRRHFNTSPGGISGNDDWGTLSSWYMLVSMGIFPASPGTDQWIVTGPIFDRVVIDRGSSGKITFAANPDGGRRAYVSMLTINREEIHTPFVTHDQLVNGEVLEFEMDTIPNPKWGRGQRPYSLSDDKPDFKVTGFELSDTAIQSGGQVTAKVSVENTGAMGSYPIQIYRKGAVVHEEWTLLDHGESKDVDIPLRLYREGSHRLFCSEFNQLVEVEYVPLLPNEAMEAGKLVCNSFVEKGDSVNLKGTLMNRSGRDITIAPELFLNGKVAKALEPVLLQPGQVESVSINLPTDALFGLQEVKLAGGPITRFKVIAHPSDALALHYKFDHAGGSVTDYSGFGHDGAIVGTVKPAPGVSGKGLTFRDGYVRIPDSPVLDISGDELTMMCWYKPTQEKDRGSMITRGAHNMLKLNGKWQVSTAIGGWGRGQATYNASPKDSTNEPYWLDQWTHFASRRDSDSLTVYVNGDAKSRLPHKGYDILDSEFEWRIGSNSEIPIGRTPDGVIDEVRIYARALSDAEILEIARKRGL